MSMNNYKFTLAAGESVTFPLVGNFIRCTSASDDFTVQPDNGSALAFKAQYGLKTPVEFNSVVIESASAQTIELTMGKGELFDNRLAGSIDLSGALSVKNIASETSGFGKISVGVAAVVIKAANTLRQSILIQNNSGNSLYIGDDNTVTTANGVHVSAGGSIELKTQKSIYGIASAAASDIRYFEESQT